jgi:UDP-glucose 4-epimerase
MSKALVTGAAGFIGSHVCDELVKLGMDVVALDDLSGGFLQNVPSVAKFVKGSVLDFNLIDRLFMEHRFDYVYHLAAYAAEGLSHFIRRFNYTNNTIGSINLINASVNTGTVKSFVFTSSIAVYGRGQVPMTESLPPQPEDPYGVSKYAVELDLRAAHEMFGLNYVIFRPHNVYGEKQNLADPYRNVIGIFMNRILKGEELPVFGDGKQTRAFSYISDVAPAIAHGALRTGAANEIFNIGADKPYTILELAEAVGRALKLEPKLKFLNARKEVMHAYSNHDKAAQVFGDLLRNVTLAEGTQRMAEWARATEMRPAAAFEGIEVWKNMPPSWRSLVL